MDATHRKQKGVHYTPPELARFLARQTATCTFLGQSEKITILDPACGEGELLASLIEAVRESQSSPDLDIEVVGYETDPQAVEQTYLRLKPFQLSDVRIENADFLASELNRSFDCVIANPPYVRTQVLGGAAAKRLAQKFKLTGRVDLYQAFAMAISEVLRVGGAMGLLTSNRFLTVRSGLAMRQLLRENFELKHVFDLGDTRLFEAAVLPVIVTGVRRDDDGNSNLTAQFHRAYRVDSVSERAETVGGTLLEALQDDGLSGEIETAVGRFLIQRGELLADDIRSVWMLTNSATREWLKTIRSNQSRCFGDLAEIKVGIKTTADVVFIRADWNSLDENQPESKLLLPLITHHDAQRWAIETTQKTVLYPYEIERQKRTPIELSKFPRTAAYFEQHRRRLEGRKYVIDSGRDWYEIWVPHQPSDWAKPKIVWPDISKQPKFFFDSSGAIVNGDCYWIKLRDGVDPDWLYLMLAVANSSIATQFYDTVFHNKLYAGRRRYMTQYVNEFPLPELEAKIGQKIVALVKRLVKKPTERGEVEVQRLVQEAFGF